MAEEETPVLDALAEITAVSIDRCNLDDRELLLARTAALVAVDATPASYLRTAATASAAGITLEHLQGLLIAVAPAAGTLPGCGGVRQPRQRAGVRRRGDRGRA